MKYVLDLNAREYLPVVRALQYSIVRAKEELRGLAEQQGVQGRTLRAEVKAMQEALTQLQHQRERAERDVDAIVSEAIAWGDEHRDAEGEELNSKIDNLIARYL